MELSSVDKEASSSASASGSSSGLESTSILSVLEGDIPRTEGGSANEEEEEDAGCDDGDVEDEAPKGTRSAASLMMNGEATSGPVGATWSGGGLRVEEGISWSSRAHVAAFDKPWGSTN
jgi:hypothetical protein